MTQTSTVAQQQSVGGRNAIIEAIHEKMGICPYYKTTEILDDVLIQKESWGGKDIPENKTKLSAAANVEYMTFAKGAGVESEKSSSYYQELFEAFLRSPKPELTEKARRVQVLKLLVSIRIAFMDERMAMEARIRNRGKDLDIHYPIIGAFRVKALEKFRKENEPLLKEVQEEQDFSWQNLIGYAVGQMGYVQKTIIEKEIEKYVAQFPIWEYFGNHIPGFGTWMCAFFIAKLQDPTRFPDSGKVRAFAGVAPKNGQPMRRKRGEKVSYDPGMKEMLCKIFPESFMKVAGKFPDEPYAKFWQEVRKKQLQKAVNATDEYIHDYYNKRGEKVLEIVHLGWGKSKPKEGEEPKDMFLGYKIKTDKSVNKLITPPPDGSAQSFSELEEILPDGSKFFLNPAHVLQRSMREWATTFISDFYHTWLYLVGENPRVELNPRIMAVFAKAQEKEK